MAFDLQDQDILRLLRKLKGIDSEYPENMLVMQRHNFLKRITEIELGIPFSGKNAQLSHRPPVEHILLETALIAVIVTEASMAAYVYRAQIADFIETLIKSRANEATFPPVLPTSLNIQGVSPSPAVTATLPSATLAATVIEADTTPTHRSVSTATDAGNIPANQLNATPAPDDGNGNNGNHYGQTPKPERTKENNGNNDKPPKDNNDKPLKEKDNKPSEDSNKPPKEK